MAPADLLLGATQDVAATVDWLEGEVWDLVEHEDVAAFGNRILATGAGGARRS